GVFNDSRFVLIDTLFLKTLDSKNLCSGYAEMLKHGLISDEKMWKELISFSLFSPDFEQLQRMVSESIQVKEKIVEQDPHEQNIRKALNFGHTFGHAFESWSLSRKPILHGYAVAYGMICELYLSCIKSGFPTEKMRTTVRFIREHFGYLPITCDDYDELIMLMTHDKKNRNGIINFTLLGEIGDIHINQTATKDEIKETLDFFREG
ncbi:MAG: 3-dehydroquinate synthase, partial [Prevotella salivae]|nr:3-dehydroquinate synthase [Segatella salivae]